MLALQAGPQDKKSYPFESADPEGTYSRARIRPSGFRVRGGETGRLLPARTQSRAAPAEWSAENQKEWLFALDSHTPRHHTFHTTTCDESMPDSRYSKERIMNPIIAALLKEFKKRHELEAMEDPKAFEYFTSYCITTANGMDQGDFKETVTGGGEEGIDAIAITINGILVTDASDVSTMMESTTEAFVKYMFIQAKVGEKWESGEVLKLSHAVEGFFKDADIGRDAWVDTCREIHLEILNNAAKLSDNPSLYVAYVTSGKLPGPDAKGDFHPKKYLTQLERSLEGLDLFSDIGAHVLGNKELQSMYRSATTAATASINFKNRITLPPIAGVDQAYLGLLPAKELLA
ncbi:hypothetical protein DQF30_24030, partial [Shigella flexneri]|nr:hypothetical protein [Shigella flexneri]